MSNADVFPILAAGKFTKPSSDKLLKILYGVDKIDSQGLVYAALIYCFTGGDILIGEDSIQCLETRTVLFRGKAMKDHVVDLVRKLKLHPVDLSEVVDLDYAMSTCGLKNAKPEDVSAILKTTRFEGSGKYRGVVAVSFCAKSMLSSIEHSSNIRFDLPTAPRPRSESTLLCLVIMFLAEQNKPRGNKEYNLVDLNRHEHDGGDVAQLRRYWEGLLYEIRPYLATKAIKPLITALHDDQTLEDAAEDVIAQINREMDEAREKLDQKKASERGWNHPGIRKTALFGREFMVAPVYGDARFGGGLREKMSVFPTQCLNLNGMMPIADIAAFMLTADYESIETRLAQEPLFLASVVSALSLKDAVLCRRDNDSSLFKSGRDKGDVILVIGEMGDPAFLSRNICIIAHVIEKLKSS